MSDSNEQNLPDDPIEAAKIKLAAAIQGYQDAVNPTEKVTDWVLLASKTYVDSTAMVRRMVSTTVPSTQDFVTTRGLMELCLQVEKQQISAT